MSSTSYTDNISCPDSNSALRHHVVMIHHAAEPLRGQGKLVLSSFGQIPTTGEKLNSRVLHFEIGNVEGMVAAAERLSQEPHRNIYLSVAVYRPDLPSGSKGGEGDIISVLGLVADLDDEQAHRWAERLPLPPDLVLETSAGRFQAFYLFDTPLMVEKAKQLGTALKTFAKCDSGTSDVSHVWRIAGTLNHPNKSKVDKGRPATPQAVKIAKAWDRVLTDPDELERALPTAAQTHAEKANPQSDGSVLGHFNLATSDDLGLAADDYLRHLIDEPKGEDRSADTLHCACEMGRRGYTPEETAGVLLNPENAINAHCADQADPERAAKRAIDKALAQDDVVRRRQQRERTRMIGDGSDEIPTTELFIQDEMLKRFVFIKDGAQVADRHRPQSLLSLQEFKNATAGSSQKVFPSGSPPKIVATAKLWLMHPDRLDAETVTFRAGAGAMTTAPNGQHALNLWTPLVRPEAPADWVEQTQVFIVHIVWLFGEDAEAFLDWLAHIEQQPGQLPHYGWIHVSKVHGKGRNWISAVLARLWRGHVAASFDLVATLDGGFNGRLSRCLLAVVDEIHEGGNSTYRHAQALRQLVTQDERLINPKYGHQHVEWNSTRWLIFSNHAGAIPLDDNDRRFFVVDHDGPVQAPEYYTSLYFKLDDPQFIASVAEFLKHRNISGFNLGARPPLTKAKNALIAATRSEGESALADIVACWPVDVISWEEMRSILGELMPTGAAARHVLDRAGLVKVGKIRASGPPFGSEIRKQTPIYAVRNHNAWTKASPDALGKELNRCGRDVKERALFGDADGEDDNSDLV